MNRKLVGLISAVVLSCGLCGIATAETTPSASELVTALQQEMAPRLEPLRRDSDGATLQISGRLLGAMFSHFSRLPVEQRRFSFRSTSRQGHLANGSEGLGCGWFLELAGDHDLGGQVSLGSASARWDPAGRWVMTFDTDLDLQGKLHWHVRGARGPCSVGDALRGRFNCRCPIGGGVGGWPDVRVRESERLELALSFASDGPPSYRLDLVSPTNWSFTAVADIRHVGDVDVPLSIALPSAIASGSLPSFEHRGELALGLPGAAESFRLQLRPEALRTHASGLEVDFRVELEVGGAAGEP